MFTTVINSNVWLIWPKALLHQHPPQIYIYALRPTPSSHTRALRRSLLSAHTSPTSSHSHTPSSHSTLLKTPRLIKSKRSAFSGRKYLNYACLTLFCKSLIKASTPPGLFLIKPEYSLRAVIAKLTFSITISTILYSLPS